MNVSNRWVRIGLLISGALVLLGVSRPSGLDDVVDLRHWSYPDYTRVVVELDGPVRDGPVRHLSADPAAKRPERLYVDLEGVWVGRRFSDGIPVGDGLLQDVRMGQNTLENARLVIEIEDYERHRSFSLTHPDRLVIDVYGERAGGETLSWPEKGSASKAPGRLPTEMRPVQTVVIDPGHGGRDPGAIGVGGLREKDVTLRLAKVLEKRLRDRGFNVVTTRDDDRSLSLEERTAIAESVRGDLFVSLHANASKRKSLGGIETYYLDQDYERHSLTVAARENGIDRDSVNALQRTVARFRVSETSTHSRQMAELVHGELVEGLNEGKWTVRDLGVKKGPFYVLFLSDTPAILVEAGFLTNKRDAGRLRNTKYLQVLATEIADGLSRYRDSKPRIAARGER
ncbi:N-acetylmuramoyl-L-alanine amidase [Myxococcota bacterium]|nr:N-acetylmuramoyl-L-alanine amidase [Myxococcota bacterium]